MDKSNPFSGLAYLNEAAYAALSFEDSIPMIESTDDSAYRITINQLGQFISGQFPIDNIVAQTVTVTGTGTPFQVQNGRATFGGDVSVTGALNLTQALSYSSLNLTGNIVNSDISASAEISVSKLGDGTARQLLQTDAAGTGVEWTDNVDVPGTLDVTGAATLDTSLNIAASTTVNGIIDDDTMATASDTTLATSESIKAYVDAQSGSAPTLNVAGDGATSGSVDLTTQTLTVSGTVNEVETSMSGQTLTIGLPSSITANVTGNVTGDVSGNAGTATKLSSSRTFALTGDVTGSVSSDLTSGASISTSIAAGSIVDADINASAAIDLSKLATGALPTGITIASANIVDGSIVDADVSATAEIAVSKLANGTTRQLLQTDAAGTDVEWASNIDVPGTLDVTGVATFDTDVVFGGAIDEKVYNLTGTALDPANGTIQYITLAANTTFTDSLAEGESITLMIDDGTAYTVTWPTTTWVNNAGAAPTLATTGYTVVVLWKVSTTLYGALVGDGS